MNREDNLCWFHGKVSRDRAEQILREEGIGDGVFLVRDSNSSGGDYVLSVLHKGEVWHYQIRRHGEDAFFSIDDQTPIHGLDSLIEHYQEASHGLVTQLSAIVKRDPPPHDSRSHGRTNLLHRATKEGDFTVVSELLKCGYRNIDAKNQDGQTAVHLACRFGNERMIQTLIESGANVNCRDTDGNTPLHYACRNQSAAVIKMLADAKANLQARNNGTGCVPMHDAAKYGNLEAVKELLQLKAPHMPRSTFGELPIDYAKDGNHKEVVQFLESYNPPEATIFKFQWYHGTLDRNEANLILKQFAKKLNEQDKNESSVLVQEEKDTKENTNEDSEKIPPSNLTSGVFLIRFSEKNGDYVLTLMFDNQPRHFIIQKYLKYLYIDEGPFLSSLEHLVQHYMLFSDGLPINLRHSVPPKPKPPLPSFSNMPKNARNPITDNIALTVPRTRSQPQRNMSIPTDDLMNTVGLLDISPESNKKNKNKKNDLLNFRSLNSRSKKNKNKSKDTIKKEENTKNKSEMELLSTLGTLKFSTNFNSSNTLYNVPSNNTPVKDALLTPPHLDDIQNQNVPSGHTSNTITSPLSDLDDSGTTTSQDYFTQSDSNAFHQDQDNGVEEIYFVDAPIITKNDVPSTSFQYVAFKQVPFFPDAAHVAENNNSVTMRPEFRLDRLDSTISALSADSDLSYQQRLSYISCSSPGISSKPNYFIPKQHLMLNEVLGEGEFGSVYRGIFRYSMNPDESTTIELPVAIKTLHDEHCKQNRTEFLREASVMVKLSHHCIVKLIGISKGPPLMMVQELVSLGSMLNYLLMHPDQINANFELKIWASQIACGMDFLESHHLVHRDLAARNILLASKHQAKISDFGLSRALCAGNDYYQASQGGKWPIKWYAPESFNYGTFSHASDVWSFGVTLWEMFSYGQAPYGDMKGVDVIKLVEIGKRLTKPALCSENVFRIMENCWNYNPKDRPTFRHLTQFFANDPDYQNLVELINTEHIS